MFQFNKPTSGIALQKHYMGYHNYLNKKHNNDDTLHGTKTWFLYDATIRGIF